MTKPIDPKEHILILDDEPECLEWLFEYLEAKGYVVSFATTIADAVEKLTPATYRLIIADLSVPVPDEFAATVAAEGTVYSQYPGLFIAHRARNIGYRSKQVVVYSVHDVNPVRDVAERIRVSYITKGRPTILKREIDHILSYDPTSDH